MRQLRRAEDKGVLCWCALRLSQAWDWIDRRQIDAHVVAAIVLWGTIKITSWAMHYAASHPERSGVDLAAVIAAVMVPWSALQAAVCKWYFDTRQGTYEAKP